MRRPRDATRKGVWAPLAAVVLSMLGGSGCAVLIPALFGLDAQSQRQPNANPFAPPGPAEQAQQYRQGGGVITPPPPDQPSNGAAHTPDADLTPEQRARRLVDRAASNLGSDEVERPLLTRDNPCAYEEEATRQLDEAIKLWSKVPDARFVKAVFVLVCDRTARLDCTPASPTAPELATATTLLEGEIATGAPDPRAAGLLEKVRDVVKEREEAQATWATYKQRVEHAKRTHRTFDELLWAEHIVALPEKAKGVYMDFCLDNENASVQNLNMTAKATTFEIWSDKGRYLVTAPPLAGSGEVDFEEMHLLARIEGVVHSLAPDGSRVALPKLRAVAMYDNNATLYPAK